MMMLLHVTHKRPGVGADWPAQGLRRVMICQGIGLATVGGWLI